MSKMESGRSGDGKDVVAIPTAIAAAFELGVYSRCPGTDMIIDALLELADVVPPVVAQGLFFAVGKLEMTSMLTVLHNEITDASFLFAGYEIVDEMRIVAWADRAIPFRELTPFYTLGVAVAELWLAHNKSLDLTEYWGRLADVVREFHPQQVSDLPFLDGVLQLASAAPRNPDSNSVLLEGLRFSISEYDESFFHSLAVWLARKIDDSSTPDARHITRMGRRLPRRQQEVIMVLLEADGRLTGDQLASTLATRMGKASVSLTGIKAAISAMTDLVDNDRNAVPPGYGLTTMGRSWALLIPPETVFPEGDDNQ